MAPPHGAGRVLRSAGTAAAALLVLAPLAGVGPATATTSLPAPVAASSPATADRFTEIAEALETDPLYVDASLSTAMPPERAEALRAQLRGAPGPLFVVLAATPEGDLTDGDPGQLLALVHDRSGRDGVYVAVGPYGELTIREYGVITDAFDAAQVAMGPTGEISEIPVLLERFVETYLSGEARQRYDAMSEQRRADEDGGDGSGLAVAAVVFGVMGLSAAVIAVVWLVAARRGELRLGGRSRNTPGDRLRVPARVLESVRDARLLEVREEARSEVLALGERLDDLELDPKAPPWSRVELQEALDAYDAAGRTFDRADGLADLVGALVLAEMGLSRVDRATARREPHPMPRPCYFNPLHGAAVRRTRWSPSSTNPTSVEVYTCRDCGTATTQGRTPDLLRLQVDGRDTPYFDSGIEPWASTGYGSLRPDLVTAVLTGRGGRR